MLILPVKNSIIKSQDFSSINLNGKNISFEPNPVLPMTVLPNNVLSEKLGVKMTSKTELSSTIITLNINKRDENVDTVSWKNRVCHFTIMLEEACILIRDSKGILGNFKFS